MNIKQLVKKSRKKAGGSMLRLARESGVPIASLWRMWSGDVENPRQGNIDKLNSYVGNNVVE